LQWARNHGFPWSESVCSRAVTNRDLEMLDWAHVNGCPWQNTYESLELSFERDHREILTWFSEHKIGFSVETCARAAHEGKSKFFRWLYSNSYPWDETSCANAAERGHYKILAFARAHGCPSKVYPIDSERSEEAEFHDSSDSDVSGEADDWSDFDNQ
jgi:hypothetical protein